MIAAITLFVILFLTVLVTRVATIALTHTGLAKESARFQARSALTGSGFTTDESEKVVNHPVRRRIILMLMLVGNAGIVTAVSSLILTFVLPETQTSLLISIGILLAGVSAVWWIAQSEMIDRFLSKIIDRALKRYTALNVRDYAAILHVAGEYQVSALRVDADDWIAHKTLSEVKLWSEGIVVLGIQRQSGNYIGAPDGSTKILPYDVLTIYGKVTIFESLDTRKKGRRGDNEHKQAVAEHEESKEAEKQHQSVAPENGERGGGKR